MTGTARGGRAAARGWRRRERQQGFLGLNRMRLLLPLPMPENLSARTLRTHLSSHFINWLRRWVQDRCRWQLTFLVAISVGVFWCMSNQAVEKHWESLDSMCEERARMLQDQFNVSINHLQALAILISTFHRSKTPSTIDQMTFARYAKRTAFDRPLMSGVAYAVRVTHAEREMFERQQGWSIKKMYSSKKQSTEAGDAEVREPMEEYAPVIFAQDGYKHVVSFDMLSGNEDRENVLRARESGKGVLTAPFKLLNNRLGVISTYTVYKTELPPNARPQERIQAAIGYLGGIFDIEALVDKLLHQLAGKKSIVVNIYDNTNDESPIIMYGSNDTGSGMCHVSTLNFGDPSRKHEMHCRFMQKQPPWAWLAIKSSFGTLVIALLIGYTIHAAAKRTAKVEDDYQGMIELKGRAEAADVAKSQLFATVSHKIRTQMNGVLGMLQMLMDTDLVTTQQDYVRTAQASAKAPFSLINEVLDQATIDSGKLELVMVPFDLRTVCDDILSLFCWKAQEKGLELAVYVSSQVPETLIGDPGRIRQIMTNLVGNSIKFTERGHIYLTVHLVEDFMHCLEVETGAQNANTISGYPVAKKCSWEYFQLSNMERNSSEVPFAPVGSDSVSLIISVEDTGVGIPFEAQSRVFTPFMQAGPSIARIHGGTGIGSSINRCLIGLMKGGIKFASKPQVGSTFTFTAVLTRACSRGNENKSSEFKEINALVVDHRPVRAEVTKYHLQRLGVQTELTTDLHQYISKVNCGLQIAKLVLIDKETWLKESHSMPHLVSKLRSKAQTYPPKLFLLENPTSSVKSSSHVSREYNLNVIMKPLRASLLQVSLRRALGGDADEGHFRNGGVGNSTVDCLLFRNIVDCLLHKKQIIVVDDDIVSLKLAAAALKKYGAEVTCVDSGKKAITLLQPPHSFDGCFMDIHMLEMDGFEATSRIRAMERDLNERIGRGELPPECASVGQWRTPILAMTADVSSLIHEACLKSEMDGYVSKPFEGGKLYSEYARFVQTNKNPSSLELSNVVNHQILEMLEQDEIVSHKEGLHLEVQEKLDEAERKLEELRRRSKFITMVIKNLTSVSYLKKKKVLSVSLLGLMLYSLLVITGAFDFPFHQSLRITRAGQNMMVNDFGWSHGRLLYATLGGTWANETASVDLKKMAGNNDSSGRRQRQQQHWYSHYSIKYQESTEMQKQNRTVKPHLPAHMSHKSTVGPWIWIALVSLTMLVLGIIVVWLLLWCNRRKRVQQNELELFGGLGHRRFQLDELAAATSNFRDEDKLGQGGFGPVYKGYLRNQDCHVAIKVLTKTQFEQGLREFKAEVKVMTQLRHRNIVKLVGWCNSKKRLLLVYELMAQGSLDKHLYDPEKILTWQQRYKIALDLGAGLLYLHQDCEKCIVHGDIKPANVMLDISCNAKLGDFGLARLIEHEDEPKTTQVVAGTAGYIDPEFVNNRWPRTELDVYSFGIVLLEIACGKQPVSRQPNNGASSLLAWVRDLYDRGLIIDAADQRLNGEFDQQQMERVLVTGLWCALQDPIHRPSISQAMDVLRPARAELPVLPAAHDTRHIRSLEEQAYGDLPVEDRSAHALTPSTYFTSKDSAYLLAEE